MLHITFFDKKYLPDKVLTGSALKTTDFWAYSLSHLLFESVSGCSGF